MSSDCSFYVLVDGADVRSEPREHSDVHVGSIQVLDRTGTAYVTLMLRDRTAIKAIKDAANALLDEVAA